jgi:hypothetical protein
MALFRVETVLDPKSRLYRAEVYYPDDAPQPFVSTLPSFQSHEEAAQHSVDTFKRVFPNEPISTKE